MSFAEVDKVYAILGMARELQFTGEREFHELVELLDKGNVLKVYCDIQGL